MQRADEREVAGVGGEQELLLVCCCGVSVDLFGFISHPLDAGALGMETGKHTRRVDPTALLRGGAIRGGRAASFRHVGC